MTKRESALWVWERFFTLPYVWGGDDPVAGVDCSGLVVEGLRSVGVIPRNLDLTAAGLFDHFKEYLVPLTNDPPLGSLAFWHRGNSIGHVEIIWRVLTDGTILSIGASGGGSRNTTRAAAIQDNAYVKIRPLAESVTAIVDPFQGE